MTPADRAVQRPAGARVLRATADGRLIHARRAAWLDALRPGDLVVANDAATLPASLMGLHEPTGLAIEVRLAARRSLAPDDVREFTAVVFGAGDFHTPTESRPAPPALACGDRLRLGPLTATVVDTLGHPRLARLAFDAAADVVWTGIARHGRPVQYAHVPGALALWDVWTVVAGRPAAFEPPSAGFALDWRSVATLRDRGVRVATITHAAGLSSTGDPALDARLPFDEPYCIPAATARAIARTRRAGGRIVAIGTTVVRALEHAASVDGRVHPGPGLATQRIGPSTPLLVADAILSGVHEPGTSHYELLRAFADDDTLERMTAEMDAAGYRAHEFGDSVLIERAIGPAPLFLPRDGQRNRHRRSRARCTCGRELAVVRGDELARDGQSQA
jgi:S-adenosylmethionine:tRNA ribosyltransferase-isomerase